VVPWDFVMGCSWDSIGSHGIFDGIYVILWDVVYGFHGISWDFHGFYTHLYEKKHVVVSCHAETLGPKSKKETLRISGCQAAWSPSMAAGGSIFLIARPPAFQVVLRHGSTWLDMAPSRVEPCGVFLSLSSPLNLHESPSPVRIANLRR